MSLSVGVCGIFSISPAMITCKKGMDAKENSKKKKKSFEDAFGSDVYKEYLECILGKRRSGKYSNFIRT